MTPYAAQIPNIPIPTSFAELWLQLGWVLVIALFVIVFLLFQLARISLSSRAKKSEHTAAIATVEAKNAGIVADLAVQAMKFRDELDTLKRQLDAERQERADERKANADELACRDAVNMERDKELEQLKQKVDEQDKRINGLLKTIDEKDAVIRGRDAIIGTRDAELKAVRGELEEVRKRLTALEHAPKPDTGELSKSVNADVDPAA